MPNYRLTAERLRTATGCSCTDPLDPIRLLPRFYSLAFVPVAGLSVQRIGDWLERHQTVSPSSLMACCERDLRGGIVAWHGHGFIFLDADDSDVERQFAAAHEAAHFLQDHYYPRLDVLHRLGPQIQPVLDGLRAPTLAERIDALLSHTSLYLHTHLLDREAMSPELLEIEADANAFACEVLAPCAALEQRFERMRYSETHLAELRAILETEYCLPACYAALYAERFAARYASAPTLLDRLRLV